MATRWPQNSYLDILWTVCEQFYIKGGRKVEPVKVAISTVMDMV